MSVAKDAELDSYVTVAKDTELVSSVTVAKDAELISSVTVAKDAELFTHRLELGAQWERTEPVELFRNDWGSTKYKNKTCGML